MASNAPLREVFVYYRVRSEDLPAARSAIDALHAQWQARHAGLACALLQREAEPDGSVKVVTLMEVFTAPRGVPFTWQQSIEADALAALAPWLVGRRHVEVFLRCA